MASINAKHASAARAALSAPAKEEPTDEDLADDPGLFQAFPATCPISDKKRGIRDPRPVHQVQERFEREAAEDDSWRFRRDREQAELERGARVAVHRRLEAKAAVRAAEDTAAATRWRALQLESFATERDRAANLAVRQASALLQEAKVQQEEVELECTQRIAEEMALLEIEREQTRRVEELLLVERKRVEEAVARAEAAEAARAAQRTARAKDVEDARLEAAARVEQATKLGEERVVAAIERCQNQLQEAQARLDATRVCCSGRIVLEGARRESAATEALERKQVAAKRHEVEDRSMQSLVEGIAKDNWDPAVRHAKFREAQSATRAAAKIARADALLAAATAKSREAAKQDELSDNALGQAAYVLKRYHAKHLHQAATVDERLQAVLAAAPPRA
eukprot:TRINITY_DN18644_c0_g1_i1.p1 TRINITY_DN18644_c0_g1~~TRINITY_DN18644_c0_g1_i1.p1  ORF type:complete len:411 (+),score=87.18 TRINITY_DN18644_c0_g1_i1:48-1235(+)